MRWLVTGGAGFLGINLVSTLLQRGDDVVSLDREPFDYPERPRIREIRGDIRNRGHVERAAAASDMIVHADGARGDRQAAVRAHLVDRRLRRAGSSSARRDRSDERRRALWDREGRGRARVRARARSWTHGQRAAAEVVRRARAARRVRADVRVGARGTRFPDPRARRQPLPAARRRGPVRRDRARRHEAGERDVQHRRRRLHDAQGGLPGRARCRGTRPAHSLAAGRARDLGAAAARAVQAVAAVSVDLRDGDPGFVRVDRASAGPARLAAALLQQAGAGPELPVVLRSCRPAGACGRHAPRALEAGRPGPGQARVSQALVINDRPMATERTYSIIKPAAVAKTVIGPITAKLEQAGLRVIASKLVRLTESQAKAFYAVHKERPFYAGLVKFMTEGPVVVQVLEGENAIAKNREVMGATTPEKANAGTNRKEFATNIERNAVHGADAPETAKEEIAFFFSTAELASLAR